MRIPVAILTLLLVIGTITSGIAARCAMAGEDCCPGDMASIVAADECPVAPATPGLEPAERQDDRVSVDLDEQRTGHEISESVERFVVVAHRALDGSPPGVLVLRI